MQSDRIVILDSGKLSPLLVVILRHISSNDDLGLRFQFGLSLVIVCLSLSYSHDQVFVEYQ